MSLKAISSFKLFLTKFAYTALLLLILPLLSSCEKERTIVNGLDEREANEIVVLLSTKGIDAQKVKSLEGTGGGGGAQKAALWDISVPEEQKTQAMSILNNAGLPKRKATSLLNIFSNTGLVPTDMAEKIRYQAGLASQIASTLRNIDGILDADVLISFPEEDPLNPNAPKKDITASVYVKHNGILDDPNSHLISKIRNLVASSVSGLKYDNVTVIPDRARITEFSPSAFNPQSEEDKQYVNVWTITIAKDSVTRFRIVFFSFSILVLLLILAFVWIAWKTFPLLKEHGGLKSLFHLRSAKSDEAAKAQEIKDSAKEQKQDQDLEDESSFADEGMDFDGEIDVSDKK